ncbi:MAG TPA: OsmC family peroxiredoxin [Gemmatimonas aurantiaca]|uniref:OsmC family peroxiredoxin n=2 Tax=Gemmatimonas aurantiaca TaxID=173480 RepID=A0A3D4VB07_9BACT|nr:OsmC family protein [Gemmatimonas aurantiaca]BAH39704.1 putative hydroperoxide peroxidase OsmC [Gemmatimonas aurantiaca T-27]HCT58286.1 OsmC family peroxiredoxin [Gemmatimonas aurantiaca]
MERTATAVWNGSIREGSGTLTTPSGVLNAQPYSFKLRFEDESGRSGTNPEELIAAAHAGCFTMALSGQLTKAGHTAKELRTNAVLTLEQQATGFTITKIQLQLTASVPGIAEEEFQALAKTAKENCPVSKVLNAEISLDATLL